MDLEELFKMFFEPYYIQQAVMTIAQFDEKDNKIGEYTGEFKEIFDRIPNFECYYYRIAALGKHESSKRVYDKYFGVKTSSIGSLMLSEEGFLNAYLNYLVKDYWKNQKNKVCLSIPYNLAYVIAHDFWYVDRMKNLKQNTEVGFNCVIDNVVRRFKSLKQIEDLNVLNGMQGVYLLVLDRYRACYVGQSNDMRRRIMRHWSRNDYFTGSGIDMFKARDTTRIYAAVLKEKHRIHKLEHNLIEKIPARYTINCLAGGDLEEAINEGKSILKPENNDDDFIDYLKLSYNTSERIKKCQARFIVGEGHTCPNQ